MQVIFAKGSEGESLIMAMGILMMVYLPDSNGEERGAAMNALARTIMDDQKSSQVIIGETAYSLENLGPAGPWFTVKPR